MDSHQLLNRLLEPGPLSVSESHRFMEAMLDESESEAVKGAALALLKVRSVTGKELAEFARFLQSRAESFAVADDAVLDTCGTGGGKPSFNISTAAAIIASSAGVKVAKHGNRAVTSKCGSADVLEALGVSVQSNISVAKKCLEDIGIAFLFAPLHHPTMKNVGAVRRQLGFRTIFNQLGPLANPVRAKRQLLGVYSRDMTLPMAEGLAELGTKKGLVVHSQDGLDEISPCADSWVAWVRNGEVEEGVLHLADFGLQPTSTESLVPGESIEDAGKILIEAISEPDSARFDAVLPSAAMAIYLADGAPDLKSAVERVRTLVLSGAAYQKLVEMQKLSKSQGI